MLNISTIEILSKGSRQMCHVQCVSRVLRVLIAQNDCNNALCHTNYCLRSISVSHGMFYHMILIKHDSPIVGSLNYHITFKFYNRSDTSEQGFKTSRDPKINKWWFWDMFKLKSHTRLQERNFTETVLPRRYYFFWNSPRVVLTTITVCQKAASAYWKTDAQ